MKVRIAPNDRYYQVILERCIEGYVDDAQWEVYKDGDLYLDQWIYLDERQRAENLYGSQHT
jgi:hypothetical protein